MTSKMVTEHELKVASEFFDAVESGQKPFEIRKDDRPFKVGDVLWLREVDIVLAYTGRETRKRITFCLRGWGMESGYTVGPDNSMVICPYCTSQFSAIPVNIQERLNGSQGYAIQLQRLIERFCAGDPLPYPELHHHRLLAALRPEEPVAERCGDSIRLNGVEHHCIRPKDHRDHDRQPVKATQQSCIREDVFECPVTQAICKRHCQYGSCAIQGSENGKDEQ